jgi:hypothetical protein
MKFKPCYDPRLRLKVEKLDEDKRVEFEERAAILQYDGGMSRSVAEQIAWDEISASLPKQGRD